VWRMEGQLWLQLYFLQSSCDSHGNVGFWSSHSEFHTLAMCKENLKCCKVWITFSLASSVLPSEILNQNLEKKWKL
jgi:hypothetical protein